MKAIVIIITLFWVGPVLAIEPQQTEKPDPTRNVMDLVDSSIKRIDDINVIQKKAFEDMLKVKIDSINDKLDMHIKMAEQAALSEKSRIDAIRLVDTEAAKDERLRQTNQAAILATQVSQSAEILRVLVATTADSTNKQTSALAADLAKRQTESNAELNKRITDLEKVQNASIGAQGGTKDLWIWLFAIVATGVTVSSFIFARNQSQKQSGGTK